MWRLFVQIAKSQAIQIIIPLNTARLIVQHKTVAGEKLGRLGNLRPLLQHCFQINFFLHKFPR